MCWKWNRSILYGIYSSRLYSPIHKHTTLCSATVVIFSLQLTIYLGKRDFIDNMGSVEPVGKSTSVQAALSALLSLIILR